MTRRSAPLGESQGFTIIELVTALSILTVIVVGLAAGIASTMRANSSVQEMDIAREAVRAQLETIIASDYAAIPAFDSATFTAAPLTPITGEATVGSVSVDSTNPALLLITVIARWSGILGDNTVEMSTLLADSAP
ncbi:MAG: hypothetical protein ACKVX7_14600 [Planctomycetota bacterium]